jgi:hypothetical protein
MNKKVRTLCTRLLALLGLTALTVGCLGVVSSPPPADEQVAQLTFLADQLAALHAPGCAAPNDCKLPNQQLCMKLVVDVYGDGHTVGTCTLKDGRTMRLKGAKDGIPLKCRSHTGQYAVQCLDTNNNVALDAVDGAVTLYPVRTPSWYRPAIGNSNLHKDSAYLTEPDDKNGTDKNGTEQGTPPDNNTQPPPPETPKGPTKEQIDCYNNAVKIFNSSFQKVIHGEGFTGITFNPAPPQNSSNFHNNPSYQNNATNICQVTRPNCKKPSNWSQWLGGGGGNFKYYGGQCYCSVTNYGPSCYTSLMITAAQAEACQAKPAHCDVKVWSVAVQDAVPPAKQFVDSSNSKTNTKASVTEGVKAGWQLAQLLGSFSNFGGVNNYCSPLVLDLAGDGVALTSAASGVTFDLLGNGSTRTAWVAGRDDALLTIDLDGNGRIDSGAELFGEASRIGGFGGGDGFAALSVVDRPSNGGNDNGLAEAGDLLFNQLRLWRDTNRDGVSQADELSTLGSAGVTALSTTASSNSSLLDAHGNDVGSRASFLRADGSSGLLVDVYFLR